MYVIPVRGTLFGYATVSMNEIDRNNVNRPQGSAGATDGVPCSELRNVRCYRRWFGREADAVRIASHVTSVTDIHV